MDLRIAHLAPERLRERCRIGAATSAPPGGLYDDPAIVPGDDWRSVPSDLLAMLQPTTGCDPRTVVEVIKLPSGPAPALLADLGSALGGSHTRYLGHYTSEPGMVTTTPDTTTGRRVGLHVDNFERLSYRSKRLGRRRLAINLGPGVRYVLVGALDICTIAEALHVDYERRYPHSDDLCAYVNQGRALNVLRIRIEPGEGYIAPTELLPHDGSTLDSDQPSSAAFWLGEWPSGALPWAV